ncbi:hypothetical protein GXP67_34980 [Rhodocytophaga rosea]|uniref:DUF932 domain-containing protein n=1 Tax=Rhodocytophaga rosea TaxID=2704465 RepID=A0A6C0GTK4_9BACT|nr:hypothetical protein [Rhodocytophaga rosea]QHT71498.1 hypothetical protein GXP67_34980 [Rhodocytophaga rosea]
MSFISTSLEQASSWEDICFPIEAVELSSLLPEGYQLLATDRQIAIIGDSHLGGKDIFALQSKEYSLIPNSLIRSVIDDCISGYSLNIRYTTQGEFSIAIILPEKVNMGSEQLYKSVIINNSYNGKTPFTIQGTSIGMYNEKRVRSSYYREICSNGLMGWVDDFISMQDYLNWLAAGQPKKSKDRQQQVSKEIKEDIPKEELLQKRFSHKGLKNEWFKEYLAKELHNFLNYPKSLTAQVYNRLSSKPVSKEAESIITDIGVPRMLAKQAQDRLRREEKLLSVKPNLWLVYNAVNYALFNSRSSLTINDRYKLDESALHYLTTQTI